MHAVEFINITKKFGSFFANDNISFSIEKNSLHCILGENGAGKSTLMNLLFGIYKPDSGTINVFGEDVHFNSPHDAIAKKIGMVHQHFMLTDDFTVLENVILGNEITNGLALDFGKTKIILNELIEKYYLGLDLNKKISQISISQQQKVEILKLLFRNSDILIFDEPTAVLSPLEVSEFFRILDEFKTNDKTIILITHKLNEVKEISDRVSVLRRGKLVHEEENKNNLLNIENLSRAIVGEADISQIKIKELTYNNPDVILELKNIILKKNNVNILNELNLNLKKGEVHGICGVEGNGQNEIVDIILGFETVFTGEYYSESENISLVPDDRIKKGMIKEYTIGENIILKKGNNVFITDNILNNISKHIIDRYDVRTSNPNAILGSLSGGNQQKVIIAREVELGNDILIFSHPTRGVDINATVFIHSKIIEQRNDGKSVLLISSDLDELVSLSDRLSILYNGKIIKTFNNEDLKKVKQSEEHFEIDRESNKLFYENIGKLMIGLSI